MAIETNADVAGKVRGAAAERRISQAELADAMHMTPMSMSRRLAGSTPFTPEELIRLGRVLGTPVATFFGEPSLALSAGGVS